MSFSVVVCRQYFNRKSFKIQQKNRRWIQTSFYCLCYHVINLCNQNLIQTNSLFHRTPSNYNFYDLFIFIFAFIYRIVTEFGSHQRQQRQRNHAQNSHVDRVELFVCCVRTHN